jgi:hypothetical protein
MFLVLALLISAGLVLLARFLGWPLTTTVILLALVGLWLDFNLIWNRIATIRWNIYSLEHSDRLRPYLQSMLDRWQQQGYRDALLQSAIAGMLGAMIGGLLCWIGYGVEGLTIGAMWVGVGYTVPMLLAIPWLSSVHTNLSHLLLKIEEGQKREPAGGSNGRSSAQGQAE